MPPSFCKEKAAKKKGRHPKPPPPRTTKTIRLQLEQEPEPDLYLSRRIQKAARVRVGRRAEQGRASRPRLERRRRRIRRRPGAPGLKLVSQALHAGHVLVVVEIEQIEPQLRTVPLGKGKLLLHPKVLHDVARILVRIPPNRRDKRCSARSVP